LPFDHRDRQRRLVVRGIARALKKQSSILLVVAIHDDGIEVLTHQFFHCCEGFGAGNYCKVQLAENLRYGASRLLIGTEKESLVTHIDFIVGTPVSRIKLL
jgi:uncharacterized protein (DUF779 family)